MNKIKHIYISSPFGNKETGEPGLDDLARACQVASSLIGLGFVPFAAAPWFEMLNAASQQIWQEWLTQSACWVSRCDALLRLPGDSRAADFEVDLAESLGKPVYFSVEELLRSEGRAKPTGATEYEKVRGEREWA